MTDENEQMTPAAQHVEQESLPTLVHVSASFSARLPTQRVLDLITKIEGGVNFGELAQSQPFRIVAFRALVRDFPRRDPTSLWMHAYDVEVEVEIENPTNGTSPTREPGSLTIGT
jgi:hypothetical protein